MSGRLKIAHKRPCNGFAAPTWYLDIPPSDRCASNCLALFLVSHPHKPAVPRKFEILVVSVAETIGTSDSEPNRVVQWLLAP